MAQIQSGASADVLTIDPTSKAARATLYGPDGQPLRYNSGQDRAIYDIRIKASSAATTGIVWALRNSGSKVVYIPRIGVQCGFLGTGAATVQQWQIAKFTGGTAFAGSPTTVTPALLRTSIGAPDITAAVLDTTFTITNSSIQAAITNLYAQRLTNSATQSGGFTDPLAFIDFGETPLELAANECLVISSINTQVVGDILSGFVEAYGG